VVRGDCPAAGTQPSASISFPPDELNALMADAIEQGATVDEAVQQTERVLFARYNISVQKPCPVGGDQAPAPLQSLFSLVPRSVVETVHGLFKQGSSGKDPSSRPHSST
jgi:hypothetical protein